MDSLKEIVSDTVNKEHEMNQMESNDYLDTKSVDHYENEQNDLYMKILKQNDMHDMDQKPSVGSTSKSNSPNRRPVSARSNTFQSTNTLKRSKSAMSSLHDPYLRSLNDFKYVGDQFIVGKVDPKMKSTHELRFQRLHSARLKKLRSDAPTSSTSRNLLETMNKFRQSGDRKLFDKTEEKFFTNDFKQTGNQFLVGKINPKLESPVEIRFKKQFAERLKKLLPDESKALRPLTYQELKELHSMKAIPKKVN